MSDEDRNKALLRRFYEELWSKGNVEAIPELVAEDFVDHQPFPGVPPGREGLAELVVMWRNAFPDMHETVEDLIAEEDRVVGRFTMRGTHTGEFMGVPPTGRHVMMAGIDIARVVDGKIAELWYSEQMLELMHQLGAVRDFTASYTSRGER